MPGAIRSSHERNPCSPHNRITPNAESPNGATPKENARTKRKMSATDLAERVSLTRANISVLKNGNAKAIRLSTLEAICKALECPPADTWNK